MIVDDHQVVRQGFTVFLKAFADFELVGEASNGLEAVQLCAQILPNVVLMDMVMPQMDGVTAIKTIRQQHPTVQIIALTSFTEDRQLVQNALQSGAIGYLFKDVSIDELAQAIRTAHSGMQVLSPEAARMLLMQARSQPTATQFHLSERELDVLKLLVLGLTNPQIAERLIISRSTVNFHVSSILGKLGAASRTEAVSMALQHHLVS
ncbi:MAG: response regulator transcription factor [Armatimonadetes bacterium]|nr:response regulator transcription factor [Anaerolineae bacterium]